MAQSQNISVKSFKLLENDLTASTPGTLEPDQNGNVAALIKVKTDDMNYSFDGGALGIVRALPKTDEIWVYVPKGLKKITISHPVHGVLRDYYLPVAVSAAKTYQMELVNEKVETIVHEAPTSQYVVFQVTPLDAIVEIDGEQLKAEGGTAMKSLELGTYNYIIRAPNHQTEAGNVTVDNAQEKQVIKISLVPILPDTKTISVGKVSFTMVKVDGGTFVMGATPEQDNDPRDNEKPAHQVTLSPYYIGETEVTQELWKAVTGKSPSMNKGEQMPVENVSWEDCQDFIRKLNKKTGLNFRLPTEAEWEYASRGGSRSKGYKYSGSSSLKNVAWFKQNSDGMPHDVKTKEPNELGLYDMSGNVMEFCQDFFQKPYASTPQTNPTGPASGSYYVARGGNWDTDKGTCRVSFRVGFAPKYKLDDIGLRLALSE
jgi:formylglycine-generating enzyme required for sulfatase activity